MSEKYFAGDTRSSRERRLASEDYIFDDPADIARAQLVAQLTKRYADAVATQDSAAPEILALLIGSIGEGSSIKPPISVDYGEHITIGDRVFINSGLTALDSAPITIGDDCLLGPNVQLLTPTHPIAPIPRRDKVEGAQPITLGKNVWLGGGVIVCPGVTIGNNTVVGAGSVVVKDLPANVVAVGNPARIVREINPDEPLR